MDLENIQKKGKQVIDQVANTAQEKGKQVVDQVKNTTQKKASEISEEAIVAAVDQAVNVLQIASQRVREREMPTENVSLEVSVKLVGLGELKMHADVPKAEKVDNTSI